MYVPGRGLFRAAIGAAGDIQLGEDRLRAIMAAARAPEALAHALDKAMGTAWDAELEPYRYAGDGAPDDRLTRVGYRPVLPTICLIKASLMGWPAWLPRCHVAVALVLTVLVGATAAVRTRRARAAGPPSIPPATAAAPSPESTPAPSTPADPAAAKAAGLVATLADEDLVGQR